MFRCKYINVIPSIIQSESAGHEIPLGNRASSPLRSEIREYVNSRRSAEERQKAVNTLESAWTSSPSRVSLKNLQLRELPPDQLLSNGAGKAKDLSLAHNCLKNISPAVLNLSNLEKLSISHNSLREIPRGIRNLPNLRSINFSTNAIEVIPDEIGNLTKLTSLDVSSNKLMYVSDRIGDLMRLEKLSLQENLLTEIPSVVGRLTRLNNLNLASNQLTGLPGEVGYLQCLEKLNVADNQLTADNAIPSSVAKLKKLKNLNVSGNPLSILHVDFGPFQYVSTSKMTIGRQKTGFEMPFGQLTINIANTYLPQGLAPARLLPVDHTPSFKEPYVGPVSSPSRDSKFETTANAWRQPAPQRSREVSRPFDSEVRTRKGRSDVDERSSISSERTSRHADGPPPPRRDRSQLRSEGNAADSASAHGASQDGDEWRGRQASDRAGHRDSTSHREAKVTRRDKVMAIRMQRLAELQLLDEEIQRSDQASSKARRMHPSASQGAQTAPHGSPEFSPPSDSQVRTRIDDGQEVDEGSSVHSESTSSHVDGLPPPRRRDRSKLRIEGDTSDSASAHGASQDGDELRGRPASVRAGRRDSTSHRNARKLRDEAKAMRRAEEKAAMRMQILAELEAEGIRHSDKASSKATRMHPSVSQDAQPEPHGSPEFSPPSDYRTDEGQEVDEKASVRSESTSRHGDGTPPPSHDRSKFRAQRYVSNSDSPLLAPQDGDESTRRAASVRGSPRDSTARGKAPRDGSSPETTRMRPPPVSKHVHFEQAPYKEVRYPPGFVQGGEYQAAGNHRTGFYGPTVVPQSTPLLNALLTSLHETTVSKNTAVPPRPAFQMATGCKSRSRHVARCSTTRCHCTVTLRSKTRSPNGTSREGMPTT
ncbi:MAG: hypothetical protein JF606_06200 [Burkholderiales bacterium]|nr:hypothetical protein [Burkholderiales bacterium]